jgi:hypothetical protein
MVARAQEPRKKLPEQEVHIRDIGGVRELSVRLAAGVNVLKGPNGSGKTSAMGAIARAYGAKVAIERRDGASKGVIEIPGAQVSIRQVARATGEAEIELADVGPLSRLIDPGIDDPDRASMARLKALLELYPMPVDEAKLAELAGHDDVAAEVAGELAEGAITDLLTAAERCRVVGHKLAREAEAKVEQLEGAAGGAQQRLDGALSRLGGEEGVVPTTAAEAEAAGHQAAERLAVGREAHRRRVELERRQEEIRASLGAVPDPARFDVDIETRARAVAAHEARIAELTAQIAKEREAMAGVRADLEALRRARQREVELAEERRGALAVLEQPVTGPTADEVEALEGEVERAKDVYRVARLSDEVRAAQAELETRREAVKAAKRKADALREAALSIGWRIGEQLEQLGIAGLTIVDGRLAVRDGGEVYDFATRRSRGQQIIAALRAAAPRYEGRVLALASHLWLELDEAHRAELAALAAELGIYLVTEEPAAGELRVEHQAADGQVAA